MHNSNNSSNKNSNSSTNNRAARPYRANAAVGRCILKRVSMMIDTSDDVSGSKRLSGTEHVVVHEQESQQAPVCKLAQRHVVDANRIADVYPGIGQHG